MAVSISSPPKMFGAYVTSISTSIGWGGQGGSCQMTLVEDPDNNVLIDLPEVGTAAYFNFNEFKFGGVFQRYSYKESLSGRLYDIVLESPAKYLDGIHVILDEFDGTGFNYGAGYDRLSPGGDPNADPTDYPNPTLTNQINNVWNPFAHRENYFYGGNFGNANVNSAGFPAPDLLDLLQIISEGGSDFGGPAVVGQSEYKLDVSELKDIMTDLAPYFRVKGPVQNLNAILQECCELLLLDYFVTVTGEVEVTTPTREGNLFSGDDINDIGDGGGVIDDPVITIKLIDKSSQPTPGLIASFVEESKSTEKLISADTGKEFSDNVTQRVVVGGPASRYLEVLVDNCLPVWGKLGDNAYQLGGLPVPLAYLPGSSVPITVHGDAGHPDYRYLLPYRATVFELRMALAGQKEWQVFKVMESIAKNTFKIDPWSAGVAADPYILAEVANGALGALTLVDTSARTGDKAYDTLINDLVQRIYSGVQNAASFYGKMFFAPLPYEPGGIGNNLRWINEDFQYESTWDIAESAFTNTKPISDVSFYDGDGRLKSVATWKEASDLSNLGEDWASSSGGGISSTKGGPQKDIYWVGGTPYVICDAGAQVKLYDDITTPDFGLTVLADYFFNINLPPASYITPGKLDAQVSIPPDVARPFSFGIPQQSNRYKWGPWYAYGSLQGKAEVVMDDSLRPETFGSAAVLDQAAFATAFAGTSSMFAAESGYIELAESPEFNIADRFATAGPYVTNMDINIGLDGLKTTYKFSTWTPNFGKLAKYNIDRISRINKASLAYMQQARSEAHNRPLPKIKFEKTDFKALADRHMRHMANGWLGGRIKKSGGGIIAGGKQNTEAAHAPLADAAPNVAQKGDTEGHGCGPENTSSPVSIKKNKSADDPTPGFRPPALAGGDGEAGPFGGEVGFVGPTVDELDPYFPIIFRDDGSQFIKDSDISFVVNETDGLTTDLNLNKLDDRSKVDTVRTMGLKGPLILSGWGYDIADQSIPRKDVSTPFLDPPSDTDVQVIDGQYYYPHPDTGESIPWVPTDNGDGTWQVPDPNNLGGTNDWSPSPENFGAFNFHEDTGKDRSLWKTGPVHLMWDDERQVWAGGLQIVCGTLASEVTAGSIDNPTSFNVDLLRKASGTKGQPFQQYNPKETITCYNRDPTLVVSASTQSSLENTWVIAIRLNYEWIPLWVGCPIAPTTAPEDDDTSNGEDDDTSNGDDDTSNGDDETPSTGGGASYG